jgi:predicted RNase H-like nuclease (RuvC/YqgF family)
MQATVQDMRAACQALTKQVHGMAQAAEKQAAKHCASMSHCTTKIDCLTQDLAEAKMQASKLQAHLDAASAEQEALIRDVTVAFARTSENARGRTAWAEGPEIKARSKTRPTSAFEQSGVPTQ